MLGDERLELRLAGQVINFERVGNRVIELDLRAGRLEKRALRIRQVAGPPEGVRGCRTPNVS